MGDVFEVQAPGAGIVRQRLVRVDDVTSAAHDGTAGSPHSFTVVFEGPARGESLEQGTYDVSHHGMGRFPLFLVPGGTTDRTHRYTATFNRV